MTAFNLQTCARKNILELEPYRCARDDYEDDENATFLDANENPYSPIFASLSTTNAATTHDTIQSPRDGNSNLLASNSTPVQHTFQAQDLLNGLNRYPDPRLVELKRHLCRVRTTKSSSKPLTPSNLFVGSGADEAIDTLLRAFCRPGIDKILVCPPTYGMYTVSAQVNDVQVVSVPLDPSNDFSLRLPEVTAALSADQNIKLLYLCSPGNPTGSLLSRTDIESLLHHPTWNGILVVDEAYIDFAPPGSSFAESVNDYPNLVVLQTLSKLFGLANIRLGLAFSCPEIAELLNKLKSPYNISGPTSKIANAALTPDALAHTAQVHEIIVHQRSRLVNDLPKVPGVGRMLSGTHTNFLLFEILESIDGKPCNRVAMAVYERMAKTRGVIVRFRGKDAGCFGCLRFSIGTADENTKLLKVLAEVLEEVYKDNVTEKTVPGEDEREEKASAVIA